MTGKMGKRTQLMVEAAIAAGKRVSRDKVKQDFTTFGAADMNWKTVMRGNRKTGFTTIQLARWDISETETEFLYVDNNGKLWTVYFDLSSKPGETDSHFVYNSVIDKQSLERIYQSHTKRQWWKYSDVLDNKGNNNVKLAA